MHVSETDDEMISDVDAAYDEEEEDEDNSELDYEDEYENEDEETQCKSLCYFLLIIPGATK